MTMQATAIINNFKRAGNVRKIIPALQKQTVDLHIVLVNNGMPWTDVGNGIVPDDEYVKTPVDPGPFGRFLTAYNYTGWLYFQDDDVMPKDDKFVEDLLTLAMKRPEAITGVFGRDITLTSPHYHKSNEVRSGARHTNFVKTICMIMHRKSLGKIRFPEDRVQIWHNDDTHASLEVGQFKPIHYVDTSFSPRLKQLPQWDVGLHQNPKKHYGEREAYLDWWLKKEGLI